MSDKVLDFLQSSNSYIAKIRTSSVMNSYFWFLCFVTPAFMGGSYYFYAIDKDSWIPKVLIPFYLLLCVVCVCLIIYFAIRKPDYLRSESFQIEKIKTEMIGKQYGKAIEGTPATEIPFSEEASDGE